MERSRALIIPPTLPIHLPKLLGGGGGGGGVPKYTSVCPPCVGHLGRFKKSGSYEVPAIKMSTVQVENKNQITGNIQVDSNLLLLRALISRECVYHVS